MFLFTYHFGIGRIINSILDMIINLFIVVFHTYSRAMATSAGKDQFLKQFELIVTGVKQNYAKVRITQTALALPSEKHVGFGLDSFPSLLKKQLAYVKELSWPSG